MIELNNGKRSIEIAGAAYFRDESDCHVMCSDMPHGNTFVQVYGSDPDGTKHVASVVLDPDQRRGLAKWLSNEKSA